MTPAAEAEVLAVAAELASYGMNRNAARLRAALDRSETEDERPCPIQDSSHTVHAIPWGLAEMLYPAYGHSQTLEELARRGGFGRMELGMLAVDAYGGEHAARRRGRMARWPLLDLYDMAKAGR